MMICFEGPSTVGKTTVLNVVRTMFPSINVWDCPLLAKKMSAAHGVHDIVALIELSILKAIDWSKNDLFTDRHPYVSETIYARLEQRPSVIKDFRWAMGEDVVFIYLRRAGDTSAERIIYDEEIRKLSLTNVVLLVTIKENELVTKTVEKVAVHVRFLLAHRHSLSKGVSMK